MTKQEVDARRAMEALNFLRRSGVGYIYAINKFTPKTVELMRKMTLSGSDTEAMVKMALQFAFQHHTGFKAYIAEQAYKASHKRDFRPVR